MRSGGNVDLTKMAFELQQEKNKRKNLLRALKMLTNTNFDSSRKLSYEEGVAFQNGVRKIQDAILNILQENR